MTSPSDASHRGGLIVAAPQLGDPNFERTVVLVLDHGPDGALGVVLNRPTEVGVDEILRPWDVLAREAPPATMFSGGPVSPSAVIGLARPALDDAAATPVRRAADAAGPDPAGGMTVIPSVVTVDLNVPPSDQTRAFGAVRLFAGYAGWSSGQLEDEIRQGGWFVVGAGAVDVFTARPEALWHDVLHRQRGPLALLAGFPPHPSVN